MTANEYRKDLSEAIHFLEFFPNTMREYDLDTRRDYLELLKEELKRVNNEPK